MFTHMILVRTETHRARAATFELLVYTVRETGEYRIYVARGGFGVGDVFTASQEIVSDATVGDTDIVAELVAIAKDDIDRNESGQY